MLKEEVVCQSIPFTVRCRPHDRQRAVSISDTYSAISLFDNILCDFALRGLDGSEFTPN